MTGMLVAWLSLLGKLLGFVTLCVETPGENDYHDKKLPVNPINTSLTHTNRRFML